MMEMVFAVVVTVVVGGFTTWFAIKEIKEMINLQRYMKKVFNK